MGELDLKASSRHRGGRWVPVAAPIVLVGLAIRQAWARPEQICEAAGRLCTFGTSTSMPWVVALSVLAFCGTVTWAKLTASPRSSRRVVWDEHGVRLLEGSTVVTSIAWADATATIEKNDQGGVASVEIRDDRARRIVVESEVRLLHSRGPVVAPAAAPLAEAVASARVVSERAEEKRELWWWWGLACGFVIPFWIEIVKACPAAYAALGIAIWIVRAPLWLRREARSGVETVSSSEPGGPYRARSSVSVPRATTRAPRTIWAIADVAIGVLALVALLVLG